ncbi:MAG: DNA alkylation repair protein, partial [Muribaculum sp.]|nr:DNA alkylation repair protein [Muribaculum sp.]
HPEDVEILYRLSKNDNLWQQRIAIVSTWQMIHDGIFTPTLIMCRQLLNHKHDLIHKATGWMLREIGKRDTDILLEFLDEKAPEMPRTMLRYAIERLPESVRQHYLHIPRACK